MDGMFDEALKESQVLIGQQHLPAAVTELHENDNRFVRGDS
jgi:hypothetical protein